MLLLSYTKNYLKIYLWQGVSIILNFLSMFIVLPKLTQSPALYGIYSLCIATIIFLSYTDFGFLGASYKYASESYAQQNHDEEMSIMGFVFFILLIFVSIFALVIAVFSLYPELIIKNFDNPQEKIVATKLLVILAFSSFINIAQRWFQVIFGIRIEDYVLQRVTIIGSIMKIISVFFFFTSVKYDIVGYFLFSQILNFANVIFCIYWVFNVYHYNFRLFVKSIRFSSDVYNKIRKLAYSSLYITIMWVVYIELDPFVISKLLGARFVAYYAIGLTVFSFLRTFGGMIYSPFQARFNHFIGMGKVDDLKRLFEKVIIFFSPIMVLPVISIIILARPLVINWVSDRYLTSIPLLQFLILGYLFNYISQPTGILLFSIEKIRLLYLTSTLIVIVYWIGVISTFNILSIEAFAFFRFISLFASAIVFIKISIDFLETSLLSFFKKFIFPIIPSIIIMSVLLFFIEPFIPLGKNKFNLSVTIFAGIIAVVVGILTYYLCMKDFRIYFKEYLVKLKKIAIV